MNPYITSLELVPDALAQLFTHIAPDRLDESRDERFTPREVIAHLADWEPIFQERLRLVNAQPGSTIVVYDEGQIAVERNYASRDVFAEVERFRTGRAETFEIIQGLSESDLAKPFYHPERGDLVLGDLVNMILGHDMYHVAQLSAYLGQKTAGTW